MFGYQSSSRSIAILAALSMLSLMACGGGEGETPSDSSTAATAEESSPGEAGSGTGVAGSGDGDSTENGTQESDGAGNAALSEHLTALLAGISAEDRALVNPVSGDAAAIATGKEEFESYCSSCHGVAGDGSGPASKALPVKPSNLTDPVRAAKLSAGDRYVIMKKTGIPNTPMQAFGAGLSDLQIWKILAYVETLPAN